jgi:hypothetical protein
LPVLAEIDLCPLWSKSDLLADAAEGWPPSADNPKQAAADDDRVLARHL